MRGPFATIPIQNDRRADVIEILDQNHLEGGHCASCAATPRYIVAFLSDQLPMDTCNHPLLVLCVGCMALLANGLVIELEQLVNSGQLRIRSAEKKEIFFDVKKS